MTKKQKVKKEDSKIKELEKKCQEYELNWKRAVADYQNLKRRSEKERLDVIKYANLNFIKDLLPVVDNFVALLNHTDDQGLKITVNHFIEALRMQGLREIDVLGKDFDPNTCEAIEVVKGEPNKVIEVLQNGYTYNDRLVRPARVKVGKK